MKPHKIFSAAVSGFEVVFSIRKFVPLLIICVWFFAGNLRAEDDLSPADKVQAERLQKQINKENKAANDKAERDYYKEHHPGDDSALIIVPFVIGLIIVGAVIYSKNKVAGHVFVGCCAALVILIVILALTEKDRISNESTPTTSTSYP